MKFTVYGSHIRREPVGFVPLDVEYEVEGTFSTGRAAFGDDPDDPPEVEFTKAVRIDPLTAERELVPYQAWPFSADEEDSIYELLLATASADL